MQEKFALQIGLLLALLGYKVFSERESARLFLIFWPQQISKEEEEVWKYL